MKQLDLNNKTGKQNQIRKEAFWTFMLFFGCFLWHSGFGFLLNPVPVRFLGLPLWWWISTPGMFLFALLGLWLLLRFVFCDFDLDEKQEEQA